MLLQTFESVLSRDPFDVAVRFTALSAYYELSTFDPIYEEQFVAKDRARHKKNLAYLVNMVLAEDCTDWRTIAWEILNSYASRDCWDRALQLLARAEQMKLKDRREIQAIRGQLRFLEVFGDEMEVPLDSLEWEPRILESDDKDSKMLAYYAVSASLSKMRLSEEHVEKLKDASNDLDKALGGGQEFAPVYRALLAACQFWTERFLEAAKEYERLLSVRLPSLDPEFSRELTYLSAATSYRRGQQTDKAIECCQRWIAEVPDTPYAHKLLGELHEDNTEYEDACESFRRVVDLDEKFGGEPGIRSSLALGGLRRAAEADMTKLRGTPEYKQLSLLLEDHWTPFRHMTDDARCEWVCGVIDWLLWYPKHDWAPFRARKLAKAAQSYVTAVERELASTVFSRYQKFALATTEITESARQVPHGDKEVGVMAAFCLSGSPFDRRAPTLGEMTYFVDMGIKGGHRLWVELQRWTKRNFPCLLQHASNLHKLNKFRRGPAHGKTPEIPPEEIQPLCRMIIESLFPAVQ
jgi:tetratricopeptide (TPR) repeat protein